MLSAPPLPETFGKYRILRKLGQGGMGTVWQATDTELGRTVALKVPHQAEENNDQVMGRFRREARAAAALHHPNICPVFEVGKIGEVQYLSMAFIEGRPLSDYVDRDRPWPQIQAAALVRRLALALQEAHAQKIVHRDLKPANVMIDRRGEPVIMDFGLARRADQEGSSLTADGMLVGTVAYMSPEQARGAVKEIGPASDVYSLGVILYELLTGRLPFEGTVTAILGKVLYEVTPTPRQYRPDLDSALEAICRKAMAKAAADRYPTMTAFAQALGDHLKERGHASGEWGVGLVPPPRNKTGAPPADEASELPSHWTAQPTNCPGEGAASPGPGPTTVTYPPAPKTVARGRGVQTMVAVAGRAGRLGWGAVCLLFGPVLWKWTLLAVAIGVVSVLLLLHSNHPTQLVQVLEGAKGAVTRPVYLSDGTLLAIGRDGVYRWEPDRPAAINAFSVSGTEGSISPDGKYFTAVTVTGLQRRRELKVWSIADGKEFYSASLAAKLTATDLGPHEARPEDKRFAAADAKQFFVRSWTMGEDLLRRSPVPTEVRAVALTPDRRAVAVGGADGSVTLIDIETNADRWKTTASTGAVRCLAFAATGERLVAGTEDGVVAVWPATGGEPRRFADHPGPVVAVAFHPNGRLVAACSERVVRLWDADSGKEPVLTFHDLRSRAKQTGCAFHPDGKRLAVGNDYGRVHVWALP